MPAFMRLRGFATLSFLLAAVLVATTFAIAPPADAASRRQERIWNAFDVVRHQKHDRYVYGATGPNAFDCSGLIYYSYKKRAGFRNIPRTSSAQAAYMNRIPRRHMRKGDFVFFYSGSARASNVYHVGVFAGWKNGDRFIIHAPNPRKRVHRAEIWSNNWFAGTLRGA